MRGAARIDTKAWRALRSEVKRLERRGAKVGVIGQTAAADHGGLTNAELAAVHEFGTRDGRIPERSFIRGAFRDRREKLEAMLRRQVKGILSLQLTADQALGQLALFGAGAIKTYITHEGTFAALAPSTIEAKGSSKPLVDTGQLVGSITGAVVIR